MTSIMAATITAFAKFMRSWLVSVICIVGDPWVGVVPGIIYLYIELFADKTTMAGGTVKATMRKTAASVKTRFLCIKIQYL